MQADIHRPGMTHRELRDPSPICRGSEATLQSSSLSAIHNPDGKLAGPRRDYKVRMVLHVHDG